MKFSSEQEERVAQQQVQKKVRKNPLWDLYASVGAGEMDINTARAELRAHVFALSPEDLAEWKAGANEMARHMSRLAEAFSQEVIVIAAGQ